MRSIIISILSGLLLLAGCQEEMKPFESGNPDAGKKVLIAGTTSAFKQSVIGKVMEKTGGDGFYFRVIGLEQLDKEQIDQYGAVLLVCAYMAGNLDSRVRRFLQNNPANPKVIVFYTTGREAFVKSDITVDAVTSASKASCVEKQADELAALIKNRFTTD